MNAIDETYADAVLVTQRLRVQNANAISGPMTWGFPAITAFVGAMWALERRLDGSADDRLRGRALRFGGVGVVCHHAQPLVTSGGYERTFRLSRHPVKDTGAPAAFVEEGRIHLEITLVFEVRARDDLLGHAADDIARVVTQELTRMRIAGGSVVPMLDEPSPTRRPRRARLERLHPRDHDDRRRQSRRLLRPLLPGFCLVSRADLLTQRLDALRQTDAAASVFDAWLDLSRRTLRSTPLRPQNGEGAPSADPAEPLPGVWRMEPRNGWIVPIPIGYAALTPAYAPGEVRGTRDPTLPARFVESVASIGEWKSPHRLADVSDLIWRGAPVASDDPMPAFVCRNDFPHSSANRSRQVD